MRVRGKPGRTFCAPVPRFAVCVSNEGYEASLQHNATIPSGRCVVSSKPASPGREIVTSAIARPRDGKMKAIVQDRYGSPDFLELREIDKPVVGDDSVLVSVRGASVNAADWHLMRRLPHLIGRLLGMPRSRVRGGDMAGHVEALGKHVTRFKPGDEVFGVGIGSFAEYATASEDHLGPKPRNLTFEQAAAIPLAGCTALQGLRDKGQVEAGRKVLIYGAGGGVGTLEARSSSASPEPVTRALGILPFQPGQHPGSLPRGA